MLGTETPQIKFKRITFTTPPEWVDFLKRKAESSDHTLSQIIRYALKNYFPGELE